MADDELSALATLDDVAKFLKHQVVTGLTDYATAKLHMASNVLRMLYRNENGTALDDDTADDRLLMELSRDTVAVSVAIDLKRAEANLEQDNDLSSFSSFTETAGGYSFTGSWNGSEEDVFFTDNQLRNMGIGRSTIGRFMI